MSAPAPPAARTNVVTVIALFAAVALGVSTTYFALQAKAARRDAEAAKRRAGEDGTVAPTAAGDDRGAGDEVRRLRAENLDLLRRLMEREGAGGAGPMPDGGAARMADRLEEMKKNDPERYKRLMERREQRRADIEATKEEQLGRIDQRLQTLGMADTPQAKQEADLLTRIAAVTSELGQIGDKMAALSSLPEGERQAQGQALGQQARELYGQLASLRAEDRRNQLTQLGASLGLNEDQSAMMSSSVDRILKETDPRGMRPGRPSGGGGGTRRPP